MITISQFFRKKNAGTNSIEEVFNIIDRFLPEVQRHELPYAGAGFSALWKNLKFARKNQNLVNHITGDIHYLALACNKKTILTIHDVDTILRGNEVSLQKVNSAKHHIRLISKGYHLKRIIKWIFWFCLPALRVARITVISEFTKAQLIKTIPFAKHKIRVIHNPLNPQITYQKKAFNTTRPIILHMGTKEHKNVLRTIRALAGIDCIYVIIGKLNKEQTDALIESGINYENHVNLDYTDIVRWYQKCDIVSFPTTYEGFGVPVLEANAAGRPIVAGRVASVPEIAGDAACLVDPFDVASIRNGFLRIIYNKNYRERLVANGFENIKRFAPEKIAAQYRQLYTELLNKTS